MLGLVASSIFEVWDFGISAVRRIAVPKMLVGTEETKAGHSFSKWVVLCCHDTSPRPDLLGLLAAFKARQYGVVIACSNSSSRQYAGLADLTVKVAPLGRDFSAYQQAFHYLHSSRRLESEGGAIVFVNDSVWFFQKYWEDVVGRLDKGISEGALVCGTMIVDEVPHVSGWLFGVATTAPLLEELQSLFDRNFARKSRRYNIRLGEHQILPALRSAGSVVNLDLPSSIPAVPQGYTAIMHGTECYYIKADSALRVNNARSKVAEFLAANASGREVSDALRWLARRSDILSRSRIRLVEMRSYRRAYFGDP